MLIRGGLVWLDREAHTRFGGNAASSSVRFRDLIAAQQRAICDDIRDPERAEGGRFEAPALFFDRVRYLTLTAFWTTAEGMDDLQYVGNTPLTRWDPAAARGAPPHRAGMRGSCPPLRRTCAPTARENLVLASSDAIPPAETTSRPSVSGSSRTGSGEGDPTGVDRKSRHAVTRLRPVYPEYRRVAPHRADPVARVISSSPRVKLLIPARAPKTRSTIGRAISVVQLAVAGGVDPGRTCGGPSTSTREQPERPMTRTRTASVRFSMADMVPVRAGMEVNLAAHYSTAIADVVRDRMVAAMSQVAEAQRNRERWMSNRSSPRRPPWSPGASFVIHLPRHYAYLVDE